MLITFREKHFTNKIVDSPLRKENTSKKTTTHTEAKLKNLNISTEIPHVFHILLLLKNLFASHPITIR